MVSGFIPSRDVLDATVILSRNDAGESRVTLFRAANMRRAAREKIAAATSWKTEFVRIVRFEWSLSEWRRSARVADSSIRARLGSTVLEKMVDFVVDLMTDLFEFANCRDIVIARRRGNALNGPDHRRIDDDAQACTCVERHAPHPGRPTPEMEA
jgi:hypothetical protein